MEKVKVIHCSDLGFDCDGIVRSKSEEELMAQVAEHAKTVHDVTVTEEIAEKARSVIRYEEPR
jgi:predicted small metal-binding protein